MCSLKLLPNTQYIIHAQNNGINRSKNIVFCLTVVFIAKLQGRYVKFKMSNICLATTMLPSAKERLVLPTDDLKRDFKVDEAGGMSDAMTDGVCSQVHGP